MLWMQKLDLVAFIRLHSQLVGLITVDLICVLIFRFRIHRFGFVTRFLHLCGLIGGNFRFRLPRISVGLLDLNIDFFISVDLTSSHLHFVMIGWVVLALHADLLASPKL